METDLPQPQERADQIGRTDIEQRLRATMEEGALSHGWIISGPRGSGKATLAYRIARGLLDPASLEDAVSFTVAPDARVFHLVAAKAHPDLFVAERIWDEKKAKYQTEITVETVRKLTQFLNRTASGGGGRAAIVDAADDMNRNAANALLKALEEPPAKTLLILLSSAPGRLLPTIRSRCRRIDLPPVDRADIESFLQEEGVSSEDAATAAEAARGRPGYALRLAKEDGVEAIRLAGRFLKTAAKGGDVRAYAAALTGKGADDRWAIFKAAVLDGLADAARTQARNEGQGDLTSGPGELLKAWEETSNLMAQGEGLNLDRGQLIFAIAHDLQATLWRQKAHGL